MCLIIKKPASATITRELADDVFSRNSDGFGILFHDPENNAVNMIKTLGDKDEIWAILEANMDKELLIHWRMQTHGDIDIQNCHPYELYPDAPVPSYMMHNGILSTGNAKNPKFSDTWWYIRDYLRPLFDHESIHSDAAVDMIGGHIGNSNKFAIMDANGKVTIINESAGIEWNGMWFSNTYAWSASKFGAVKPYTWPANNHAYQNWGLGSSSNSVASPKNTAKINPMTTMFKDDDDFIPHTRQKYSANVLDESVASEVAAMADDEKRDLIDLHYEVDACLPAFYGDKITSMMLLNLMRCIGFGNVCDLMDMAWNGMVDAPRCVECVMDAEEAMKELGLEIRDGVLTPSQITKNDLAMGS